MRSIASLCQINRHASRVALVAQQVALYDAIAELESCAERVQDLLNEHDQARDYADAAALAARDWQAPAHYAEIRGS